MMHFFGAWTGLWKGWKSMIKKSRYLTGQLMAVLVMTILVMAVLGIILYNRLERRINLLAKDNIENSAKAAADYYYENLKSEMLTLEHIGWILKKEDEIGNEESIRQVKGVIRSVFDEEPSVILGIMDGQRNPIYVGAIEPTEYEGLLNSFRGNAGVSYMETGALLFSYPVIKGDNVSYVLYYICSSAYIKRKHGLSIIKNMGNVSLMTVDGNEIIPFTYTSRDDEAFYRSKSVRNTFQQIRSNLNNESVAIEKIKTTKGDLYFYSAEVGNTPFVIVGVVDIQDAVGDTARLPHFLLAGYILFIMIVMIMALFLIVSSVKVRESEELREAKQVAEDASKAKGLFLANMSHEIRTPINAILGMDEMILRHTKDKKLLQYAHSIKNSAASLLGLVNDILDFSAIEAGKLKLQNEPFNLSTLVTDVSVMVKPRADSKNLEFKIDIDRTLPDHLIGDGTRLKQVIINLLTNGVKYTQEGFVYLIISYEKLSEDEINLRISVKDSGIGMKQEDIEKLFFAFERFDEKKNRTIEGTGLGMSIVKQILDAMGGKIDVQSKYGEGSEFRVIVKQKVESWECIGDFENTAQRVAIRQENYKPKFYAPDINILSVDDMEINLRVVEGLLEQTGVKITSAQSGVKALELIAKNHYDIMLIDHRMPAMDGVELLGRIRSMEDNDNRNSVCIALTANVTEGIREKYIKDGFNDYLQKPVDVKLMEDMIYQYIPKDKLKDVSKKEIPDGNTGDSEEDNQDSILEARTNELQRLQDEGLIDMTNVMAYAGTMDVFIDTVLFFRDSINEKADEIEKLYYAENIEDFTTKVHALKSSAKMVGLMELSEMARLVEAAGKNNDMDYVKDNILELLSKYRSYREVFAKL